MAGQSLMAIEIAIRHQLDALRLDVDFKSQARVVTLFGASGVGKTSIANIMAGLLRPDFARIVIDGITLCNTEQRINLPAHLRRIGLVFQDTRLFPHFSVGQNLDYGAWFARTGDNGIERGRLIELLGLQALLKRRPSQLSGGEKQRVAIARAVLSRPRLLIMDEPLASLDGDRKSEILSYIEALRDELSLPIIYVSHAREEITRLGGDVALLEDGRLAGFGPPALIFSQLQKS